MLERYFVKPDTVERIRNAWLGEPIERYVTWLTEQGYLPRTIYRRVPLLMHFAEFAWARGARRFEELANHVEDFVTERVRLHRVHSRRKQAKYRLATETRNPIRQMLALLPSPCSPQPHPRLQEPFLHQAPEFWRYLREERGLRAASIALYTHHLRRFEMYLQKIGLTELHTLSPAVLSAFVTHASQALAKDSLCGVCAHLRVFLRYLYRERLVSTDLSASVDSPRIYRLSKLPRSIQWGDVQRVLAAVDRRSPVGKRDYAFLLLLITYGLRAREVAALTLKSIDWQGERLQVPERKAGHCTAFPLSPIVGNAIVDYLQHGRPKCSQPILFLCASAPHKPVNSAVVSQRVTHYLHKAKVQVHRPGSHSLRHTCVQRLVDAQLSLKEIGDYVGHRHPKSTEIYTKIDIEALREVAIGDGEALV
jgi:site-specific recombinase XerD